MTLIDIREALASAIAARHTPLARAIESLAHAELTASEMSAGKAAAAIMSMNNIYCRFLHLVEDVEYASLPARLRMNVLANPGVEKPDFELLTLAVSAINGCGMCIASHERKLREYGFAREAIQSAIRIAACLHAAAGVLEFESHAADDRHAAAA